MRADSLTGRKFGRLTVLQDSGKRRGGSILWECRCSCGNTVLLTRHQLTNGIVTSCGCAAEDEKCRMKDLTGQQFGELTVLSRAESNSFGQTCWLCRCSCGRQHIVPSGSLTSGRVRSCGGRQYSAFRGHDLTGLRFGRLTALYPVPKPENSTLTSALWHCRCDCGAETDAYASQLQNGLKSSCGCLNQEQRARMHEHLHYENDTCLERLKAAQQTTQENRAGFRGLYLTRSGTYRASITFRKVHYTLGYYPTYKEAVEARLEAEKSLHAGYIEASEKYRARAASDPVFAEEEPFYYNVVRNGQEFQVSTNGV